MSVRNRIQPGDGDPRHGTTGGYSNHRCRCEACRAAFAAGQNSWRLKQAPLPRNDPRHGTSNGYTNYACRCRRCTEAHTEIKRLWEAKTAGD